MTTVADLRTFESVPGIRSATVRVALLGVGNVGGAVAALLQQPPLSQRFCVTSGLVRDTSRLRPQLSEVHLTANPWEALDGAELVIEALGGVEPARTLVLNALERGIPVVTANKSLLAAEGDVLFDTAARAGVPLRYEATVLAGVPFLGTFGRRQLARDVTGLSGIVNGTTNFILSKMSEERAPFAAALKDAQRLGYAEPDPANDVQGIDAAEKLCVLVRHFGDWSVTADRIDTTGIASIEAADLQAAFELGGVLKAVVCADWRDGTLSAFAGPAFLFKSHPLAHVDGVQNAVRLCNRTAGDLFFAGPGAGPAVTAATVLDDALEIVAERRMDDADRRGSRLPRWQRAVPSALATGWFVRITGDRLPEPSAVADALSACGVSVRRTSEKVGAGQTERWFLTSACTQQRVQDALRALDAGSCKSFCVRILE